jgi:hypothetical protein
VCATNRLLRYAELVIRLEVVVHEIAVPGDGRGAPAPFEAPLT